MTIKMMWIEIVAVALMALIPACASPGASIHLSWYTISSGEQLDSPVASRPYATQTECTAYAKTDMPLNHPHCEMTCFIRKNNPKANALFEKWWVEITRYSSRDQISFPIVFRDQKWTTIPGTVGFAKGDKIFTGNDFFKYIKHIIE